MTDIIERLRERGNDEFTRDALLLRKAAAEIERLTDWCSKLDAENERLRSDASLALGTATRLLESFVHEHCSPVPEWKPLPDLVGVLFQLDNATTITRDYKAKNERLRAEREKILNFVVEWAEKVEP